MSEPAHSSGRYGLGGSNVSDREGEVPGSVDEADSADGRTQGWDAPQETQGWPDRSPDEEADEPLTISEEPTAEFARRLPESEDHRRGPVTTRPNRHMTGIWAGLAVVIAGFGAIFFSWSKVAGLTNVAQQVPYLVSSGLLGLALVIVGAVIVDVFVRRWDSAERKEQLVRMTEALSDVRDLLEQEPVDWPEED